MLGPALLLMLLFLKGHQGQESLDSAEHVVGLSGACLKLQPPPIQTNSIYSVEWKKLVAQTSKFFLILKRKYQPPCCEYENQTLDHINKTFSFITPSFSLIIQAARQQDSGWYTFEVTDESGDVKRHKFRVSVFDHVGELHIQEEQKVLDRGRCQVTLSCSVFRGGNVSYDWYREGMLIPTARNLSTLEDQIDANSSHTYTCNVSNLVSWVSHTFTQHCPSDVKHSTQGEFLLLLVVIVVCLITLLLGTLTGLCMWRRKRKQSQASAEEFLTVYEDVNNAQITTNQEQKLNPPGEGSTIYSMIQSQPSASASQETNTLYALVQPSRKSESKKNKRSSLNKTIYEEVGRNPARLSRRELENFSVYS